jgi:hypothetical protein
MLRPTTLEELSEAVRKADRLFITGIGGHKETFALPTAFSNARQMGSLRQLGEQGWKLTSAAQTMLANAASQAGNGDGWTRLDMKGLSGIVEYMPEDQVVAVRAGTSLEDLQAELAKQGQCLPYPDPQEFGPMLAGFPGTVGGTLAMNLPHALRAQCGTWRDWVLGMTVVRADGEIARCGSKAVKNVAGYDVQKLMIGSRGSLAVVAEVILRVFPLRAMPRPTVHLARDWNREPLWIQRVQRTDFERASALEDRLIAADEASSTLWAAAPREVDLPRYDHDWVLRSGCGDKNLKLTDPQHVHFMRRAKEILDPDQKLNAGVMGIF